LTDLHLILEDGNRLRVVQHEFIFFVFALRGLGTRSGAGAARGARRRRR